MMSEIGFPDILPGLTGDAENRQPKLQADHLKPGNHLPRQRPVDYKYRGARGAKFRLSHDR
jgi:hypothetical protein